jgi:hypothetical protein
MKENKHMKTTTTSIYRAFALFAVACFALSPQARAQCPQVCDSNANTFVGNGAGQTGGGQDNTAIGANALTSNTTGNHNTAEGDSALFSLTTATDNTASGFQALFNDTTGNTNVATGSSALQSNTIGGGNTACGAFALQNNTTASGNTATGLQALFSNTTGSDNTASGTFALLNNTTGSDNAATGRQALFSNTTGNNNTATGYSALSQNTTGNDNTAIGFLALQSNTTGIDNTANGSQALQFNTTGNFNTANGNLALTNNTTGSNNIALGPSAGINLTTGSNNIDIGNSGVAGESKTIRIGTAGTQRKTFIAGISGATVASGVGVIVGSNGQLGTVVSSERFKDAIKPMDKASEAILALKPVTFRYKRELDPEGIPQFGLVAEQVEKVDPALVARDADGKIYTVRYDAVNAMLLNEFLKEHRKVQELESKLAQQQKDFTARLEEQDAKIQQVNDRVELSEPSPRTVDNN